MKKCPIQADGCEGTFEPKTYWQFICNNKQCKDIRMKEKQKQWRKDNREYINAYMRKYSKL